MRIFVSAGEPSGDLHAANLVQALRERRPDLDFVGYGGPRLEEAGCQLLYPLTSLAVMWFLRVLANAPTFLSLISRADRFFRHQKPDAVVLIDYPGLHWWLARRAHFHKIPVFYFVPPQLWAWAPWRVKKMQRFVDHVLCTLPFEQEWYRERGVAARFVGHPFFDEVGGQVLDEGFVASERRRPGPIVGILPGSRNQEVKRNLSTLIRAVQRIHQQRPEARFLAACFNAEQARAVEEYLRRHPAPVDIHVGRTPEIIELARCCLSVSGSVSLELLTRGTPTAIVYRIGRLDLAVARRFINCPYITLVNMLAQKEVFPEFLTDKCEAAGLAEHAVRWLSDEQAYAAIRAEMAELRRRVARPGACERAAEAILDVLDPTAAHTLPLAS